MELGKVAARGSQNPRLRNSLPAPGPATNKVGGTRVVAIANSYNSGCKEGRRKRDTSSIQPTTTSKGPHQTRSSTGYLRELLDRHRDIVRRHRAFFIAVSQFYQYYETAANCTPASIVMLAVLCQRQQGKLRPHTNGTTTGGHIT